MKRFKKSFIPVSHRDLDQRYQKWRKNILKRDKKCVMPGCNSCKKLQVHHILRWADNINLRYSERNGITLCKEHHKMIKDKEHHYVTMFMRMIENLYKNDNNN